MEETLIFFLYRLFLTNGFVFLVLYVLVRAARNPKYRRGLGERFGLLPASIHRTEFGAIWLHAVSVGEVISAIPLLKLLKESQPARPIFVSCGTTAGREAAETKLAGIVSGVFFAPFDAVFLVRRVLRRIRPALVIICETEIWPNLWREARRSGARLVVVNGRISDQAMPRYLKLRWLLGHVLAQADRIFAQSETDAARYRELGAMREVVSNAGNLKYDFQPSANAAPQAVADWLLALRPSQIWIAASTVAPVRAGDVDEDDVVLDAFSERSVKRPGLLLILVPRKPERFDVVAGKLRDRGIRFVRRSETPLAEIVLPGVLLLDTVGELGSLFPYADAVFVGGTLADRGGHNVLEPAACAKPIVVGPHLENFRAIAEAFRNAQAFLQIGDASELRAAVERLLDAPGDLGERARSVAASQQGVARRIATELDAWHDRAVPARVTPVFRFLVLKPAAALWTLGARLHRRRRLSRQVRLNTPVVSVGNLTLGGSGKTPMVLWLAEQLRAEGLDPAVLTRGYGRSEAEPATILERGSSASVSRTGEEAQMLLRSGLVHLGIGADRARSGLLVEKAFRPDVFLLDDGFQHVSLGRDFDLVLLDASDPFGGDAVFPLGWLREPLTALRRADAIVITRTVDGREYSGIRNRLGELGVHVPVYLSRLVAQRWRGEDGSPVPLESLRGKKVAAFCAIGRPEAFWKTLEELGCEVILRRAFRDHHRYSSSELAKLSREASALGAEAMVTTEKDSYNLLNPSFAGTPLYSLEMATAVDDAAGLLGLLRVRRQSAAGSL